MEGQVDRIGGRQEARDQEDLRWELNRNRLRRRTDDRSGAVRRIR